MSSSAECARVVAADLPEHLAVEVDRGQAIMSKERGNFGCLRAQHVRRPSPSRARSARCARAVVRVPNSSRASAAGWRRAAMRDTARGGDRAAVCRSNGPAPRQEVGEPRGTFAVRPHRAQGVTSLARCQPAVEVGRISSDRFSPHSWYRMTSRTRPTRAHSVAKEPCRGSRSASRAFLPPEIEKTSMAGGVVPRRSPPSPPARAPDLCATV